MANITCFTWSQFKRSLKGARWIWMPGGMPISPIHSSIAVKFMLIWTARDLRRHLCCDIQIHLKDEGTNLQIYFFLVITRLNISPSKLFKLIEENPMDKLHAQDVQYMTCDHNWVVMAGLISDRTRSVWREVRNEVKSNGEGEGRGSWKTEDRDGADDCPLARVIVWRKEEKPREADKEAVGWFRAGDSGLCGLVGGVRTMFFPLGDAGGGLRFPVNGRRNDHSDSNCTASNSEAIGTYDKMVTSRSWSIRRSANRIIKTARTRHWRRSWFTTWALTENGINNLFNEFERTQHLAGLVYWGVAFQ